METKKKIDIVGPKVIDVEYRLFLLEEAGRRKIINLDMKNIRDKEKGKERLEILLGDYKEKIDEFIKWIMIPSNKPDEAEIDEGGIKEESYVGDIITREEYYKTFTVSQLTKMATSGVKLLKTQNKMFETQNKILERQDNMFEIQSKMLERQDNMFEIQSKMLETQNKILERQDKTFEIQNKMFETQNKMLERQDKISDSIRETVDLQTDIKSRISRFSIFGQQIVSTQDEIKDKIERIGKDLKMYINERIDHIDQRIDEMKIVKRQ